MATLHAARDVLDWFRTLPPEAWGMGALVVLLLLACLGWAHTQSTLTATLAQTHRCAKHWEGEAQRLTQRNLNLVLAQNAGIPAPNRSPSQKLNVSKSPTGVKHDVANRGDWRDSGLYTQPMQLEKALTLVWHKPGAAKTPPPEGVVQQPPKPLMRRPPNGLLRVQRPKRSV